MLPKFPFGTGEKNGPSIMESLKAIGEVAELLTDIRDQVAALRIAIENLNTNLARFVPKDDGSHVG